MDYVKPQSAKGKPEREWASPDDYQLDLSRLLERIASQQARIARVRYELSPDISFTDSNLPTNWQPLGFDQPM